MSEVKILWKKRALDRCLILFEAEGSIYPDDAFCQSTDDIQRFVSQHMGDTWSERYRSMTLEDEDFMIKAKEYLEEIPEEYLAPLKARIAVKHL